MRKTETSETKPTRPKFRKRRKFYFEGASARRARGRFPQFTVVNEENRDKCNEANTAEIQIKT